jgi:hypothetical protein
MIRALSEELYIPIDLLIQESSPSQADEDDLDSMHEARIPIAHILRSGQFPEHEATLLTTSAIVQRYLKPKHGPLYLKQTITYGATPSTNKTNLKMWVGRVRELAHQTKRKRGVWRPGTLNEEFLTYVARLSWSETGPRLVQEFLAEKGIALVILPHYPQTKLDGQPCKTRKALRSSVSRSVTTGSTISGLHCCMKSCMLETPAARNGHHRRGSRQKDTTVTTRKKRRRTAWRGTHSSPERSGRAAMPTCDPHMKPSKN